MTEKVSLTELQLIIKDSLYLALPDMYWVLAEIAEIKENSTGHCYLELVEKHAEEKNVRARAKAIIWSSRYSFLKSFFENITGESLRDGLKILVKVQVEYHEIYGLSLIISDIDPSYTIGEMAMKRQVIIRRLEEEGVFTMNKEVDFPAVAQRIAVISSKNAAGYSDFINHLTGNSKEYVFYTLLIETVMQGIETEQSLIRALDKIALNSDKFDLVVIIRGGGSQTDLSWFDNYNIAYYVTQFPLPIITGIGHEKDLSVTDMVAFQSLKTPTAVADYIIDCMSKTENHLFELSSSVTEIAKMIIEQNRKLIDSFRMKLIPVARLMMSDIKEELSGRIIEIINIGKEYIVRAGLLPANQRSRLQSAVRSCSAVRDSDIKRNLHELIHLTSGTLKRNSNNIKVLENRLETLRPENVLRRGYTITSSNGKILKSKKEVIQGELIDTQFSDGSVSSRVV
jgi:exodeoxyribonuclease VII large subunit